MGGPTRGSNNKAAGVPPKDKEDGPEELSDKEANAYDKQIRKELAASLTVAERNALGNALDEYQGSAYEFINGLLRGNISPATLRDLSDTRLNQGALEKMIARMTKAMNKIGGLPRAATLYRAPGADIAKLLTGMSKGTVFQDKGFVSTTFSKKTSAFDFKTMPTVLRIHAPKGTKGITMHKGWGEGRSYGYRSEKEIVLKAGTKYKITGKTKGKNGQTIIDVKIIR